LHPSDRALVSGMTEPNTTGILRLADDGFWLFTPGNNEPLRLHELDEQHRHYTFAAPAEMIRLTVKEVQPDERRHLTKALPSPSKLR